VINHNVQERIRGIIADVTHLPLEKVAADASCENIAGWDSVAQINVIIGVESEFGVSFSVEELHSLNSVGKIRSAVELALGDNRMSQNAVNQW
jgi:acyl carrier protein